MKTKVFVDGQEGTTGLKIHERLEGRGDIELLEIDPQKRKDAAERSKYLNAADIVFLCLPDDAARESVSLITNPGTRVLDASTAHRTAEGWTYGIPELSPEHRKAIQESKRVAVPGCYASGFVMLAHPLVKGGILQPDYPVTCHAVTGYSGGGKKLIEQYEDPVYGSRFVSPSFYALGLQHKHLPEMQKHSGLENPPLFTPILGRYYQGMTVTIPLFPKMLGKKIGAEQIQAYFTQYFQDSRFVKVMPYNGGEALDDGRLPAEACNGTNRMEIFVFGDEKQVLVAARLDNLGKGASGAAVQNMNLMIGADEAQGLSLYSE